MAFNNQPLSLLSILFKVLKRIVIKNVYKHVEPVLTNGQSGFREKDGAVPRNSK